MKNWFKILGLMLLPNLVFGQNKFSVEDALNYAVEHNINVQKAKIDQTIAKQKVKETIGIGLPQLDAVGKYNYFLKIPVQLLPAEIAGGKPGDYIPVKFGQKQNMTGGLTLTQLLFNGSYIVGLESSKTYKETAELVEQKTEISLKEGILMAYAAVLVTNESIKTLEENIKVANKDLHDVTQTYKAGLAELQSVEQQQYVNTTIITNKDNLYRNKEKALMAVKYLMGYPLSDPIELTTTLDEILEKNQGLVEFNKEQNVSEHIDYRLKENQLRLSQLKLKLQKSHALPTLVAAISSNYNAFGNQFNFFNSTQKWFNTSVIAVQLDIPIFSGLQRHWQTQQAKLDLEKSQLDLENTKRTLENNIYAASIEYDNAYNSYKNSQELIKLATSIYKKQQTKFSEGIGTSFDLHQAETQVLDSQAKYYQSALNLIQAKVKLDEALGKL